MPEKEREEAYSNPLPPSLQDDIYDDDDEPANKLTNDDFRKLLMTPRGPKSGEHHVPTIPTTVPQAPAARIMSPDKEDEDDPAAKRKKKKSYYAKLKKLEEEREKELAQKYRDRARERRDGVNKDYEQTDIISTTADYRAVAPDAKSGENLAERRKQIIQESKYLGGDMEHTHLVKGLDYALLEKVRAEITNKEDEEEGSMEAALQEKPEKEEDPEEKIQFRTKMGRNIIRTLFKNRTFEKNDLFLPGRMAYVVDLEDDFAESDIPTTMIRSKADCPNVEATATLTTNDIVINKLTQILSYLRQGRRDRKMKKKDKAGKLLKDDDRPKMADDSIYGEGLGDYLPSFPKAKDAKDKDRKERERGGTERERDRDRHADRDRRGDRDRDRERHDRDRERGRERVDRRDREREIRAPEREEKKKSYFEKPAEEEESLVITDKGPGTATELVQSINERFGGNKGWSGADIEAHTEKKPTREEERMKKIKTKTMIDSYAECYPGMMESADAIDDSDDEVDYTKMDQGNKKGPVGRWDFETQEEYSDYMANKEALPKAAFQYGVKMADGRKTRRTGPKDEKKELDREWQKIQNIIQKRKQMGNDGGPFNKVSKY